MLSSTDGHDSNSYRETHIYPPEHKTRKKKKQDFTNSNDEHRDTRAQNAELGLNGANTKPSHSGSHHMVFC